MQKRRGARARGQLGHVAVAGWPVHGTVRWTGARGRGAVVHGGPRLRERALAAAWTRSMWTGVRGGRPPRWTARRNGGERRRRRHDRPRRARSGGAAGHGGTSGGHGWGRLDTASAMAGLPPRNDEGKEKLDGGARGDGCRRRVFERRRRSGFGEMAARVLGARAGEAEAYLKARANLVSRAGAETEEEAARLPRLFRTGGWGRPPH